MAKIYNYLDIKNYQEVSEKLHRYVVDHTSILENKINWTTLDLNHVTKMVPELASTLSSVIPNRIVMVAIFYAQPGLAGSIHIDVGPLTYRVLWPVHNCQGSSTKFFDINGNEIIEQFSGGTARYLSVDNKHPVFEIADVPTSAPFVFDVRVPHGIYTNPDIDGPRLTATIGFENDYEFEKTFLKD